MSITGKPLRVIAAFQYYSVGDIIYPTGIYRDQLKNWKLCEEVERDEGDAVEVATIAPEERAVTRVATGVRRRRRSKLKAG